ncbi:Gluconate 5-dehydrogenase [Paraburkholderia nemoris]|uniref:SDR family NAD(P)-dependent oxidoreductase n=1 Tax=Paraburkholderia nemoris TaxID=2793076 RepID=UPI001909BC2A|nr:MULTISPECIES: SDR family oxidoreductase [Paraburkholderia]CAE6867386.1 Gluconate 5-dehydrogenase [Paraburkholderia nemoris]
MFATDLFSGENGIVCISGASRGLGKGLAIMFAERGAHVVVAPWDQAELVVAQTELAAKGLKMETVASDVSDPRACEQLVVHTVNLFGRIDTMICNVGIDTIKAAEDYENGEWDRILDVNLKGAYFCARYAGRAMLAEGKGSIIIGVANRRQLRHSRAYALRGIDQLVRTKGVEWAQRGVRVNAVAPGYINNFMDGVDTTSPSPYQQRAMTRTSMGRRGEIAEFGGYIFLAIAASSYMTEKILYVDGGCHAG